MIDALRRLAYRIGTAALIAAVPATALSVSEAMAQAPGFPGGALMPEGATMPTEPYTLTPEIVANFVSSYQPIMDALAPYMDNSTPGPDAVAALNDAVTSYGFSSYVDWVLTFTAIGTAYQFLQIPADQRPAMMAMIAAQPGMAAFTPTDDNMAAVQAHYDDVAAIIDNM